jgi:hypothetical protein
MSFSTVLRSAARVVRFAVGGNLSDSSDYDTICDVCQSREATLWCVNDRAKFCEWCDSEAHSLHKFMKRHRRLPISEARTVTEFCPFHSDARVEYYCRSASSRYALRAK